MYRYYVITNEDGKVKDLEVFLDDENTLGVVAGDGFIDITDELVNAPVHPDDLFSQLGQDDKVLYYVNNRLELINEHDFEAQVALEQAKEETTEQVEEK